jgi:hypothetical protein
LHLLAKPKETQRGFSINIGDKELYWIEDFIQGSVQSFSHIWLGLSGARH